MVQPTSSMIWSAWATFCGLMIIDGIFHSRKSLVTARRSAVPVALPPIIYPQRDYFVRRSKLLSFPPTELDDPAAPLSRYPTCEEKGIECQPEAPHVARYAPNGVVYVVVPKSLISQWKSEWDRFFVADEIDCIIIDPPVKSSNIRKRLANHLANRRNVFFESAPLTVICITHSTVAREFTSWQANINADRTLFLTTNISLLLLDQGHRLRNTSTVESQAVLHLLKRSAVRVLLSATVYTNSARDLLDMMLVLRHPVLVSKEGEHWTKAQEKTLDVPFNILLFVETMTSGFRCPEDFRYGPKPRVARWALMRVGGTYTVCRSY